MRKSSDGPLEVENEAVKPHFEMLTRGISATSAEEL
jgi:hypothetical protein